MKNLILLAMLVIGSIAQAGAFSEIDLVTRETVAKEFRQGFGDIEYNFDIDNDIWSLDLVPVDADEECLAMVTGFARGNGSSGYATYKFWVCITRDGRGFDGELYDTDLVGE